MKKLLGLLISAVFMATLVVGASAQKKPTMAGHKMMMGHKAHKMMMHRKMKRRRRRHKRHNMRHHMAHHMKGHAMAHHMMPAHKMMKAKGK